MHNSGFYLKGEGEKHMNARLICGYEMVQMEVKETDTGFRRATNMVAGKRVYINSLRYWSDSDFESWWSNNLSALRSGTFFDCPQGEVQINMCPLVLRRNIGKRFLKSDAVVQLDPNGDIEIATDGTLELSEAAE